MANVVSFEQARKKSVDAGAPRVRDLQHEFIMDMATYCLDIQPDMNVHDKADLLRVLANLLVTTDDAVEALS